MTLAEEQRSLTAQPASPRPVCACGQTVWSEHLLDFDGSPICADCVGDRAAEAVDLPQAPLVDRIRAAQVDPDPTSDWSAWAHPGSEGP